MNKDVMGSLSWGVGIVILALGATYARQLGYMNTDTVTRLVMGATGLMVAWFGNRMPKTFVPSEAARKVTRLGGWSLALSGLIYAGVWAFAPLDTAVLVGCSAVPSMLAPARTQAPPRTSAPANATRSAAPSVPTSTHQRSADCARCSGPPVASAKPTAANHVTARPQAARRA